MTKWTTGESNPPEIGIVVLNWNNYDDTAECISSMKKSDYKNYTIYVVDNGSNDGSAEKLISEFSKCQIIKNKENMGFSKGCNRGISRARSDGVDYILLLNNDVVISKNTLTKLIEAAISDDDIGIVGGVMRYMNSTKIYSAGGKFYPYLAKFSAKTNPEDGIYETEFVTGAMMLISEDVFESLGELLNEKYFFGMEDQEISWKARRTGWKVVINPEAVAYHKKGASAGSGNAFRYYHQTRNRLIFAQDNLAPLEKCIFYIFFTFTRLYRFIQWIIGQRILIKATILGVYDWYKDRYPKRMYLINN